MNRPLIVGVVAGIALGSIGTYWAMRGSAPPAGISEPREETVEAPVEEAGGQDPFVAGVSDLRTLLSGRWTSVDGQIHATLESPRLRFGEAPDWPDLENHTFLLGKEMQFLSARGIYLVKASASKPDEMWFCVKDSVTGDLHSFTLFREGTPDAASRAPISRGELPPKVRGLLEGILTLRHEESLNQALQRLNFGDLNHYEVLQSESGLGETDLILNLGIDDHWMLALKFRAAEPGSQEEEAVLLRFKLFQGYLQDVRSGRTDFARVAYPYFENGKIITAPSRAK